MSIQHDEFLARPSRLFESRRPIALLWEVDRLLASVILRFSDVAWDVEEFHSDLAVVASVVKDRKWVLLVGADPLRSDVHLRLLHKVHRGSLPIASNWGPIIALGALSGTEALVARELGVAAVVSNLHDAVAVARAVRRFMA